MPSHETDHNIPFYFALPRRGAKPQHLCEARGNIARQFGIGGRCEYVRTDTEFYLFRVVTA